MALGLCRLADANEVFHLTGGAAVGFGFLLDLSIFAYAIGRGLHHGAFKAMVRLVADPNMVNRPFDMLAVSWPRLRHVFHQFVKALLSAGGLAGVGKALQHALVGNTYHASV